MKTIYLARHCRAVGQSPDAPLTAEGHAQALALVDFLGDHGIERIVSSPFVRARASIEPLACRLGIPIETDPRLVERNLGEPSDDWLNRLEATFTDLDLRFEGGESSRDAMARAAAVLDEILASPAERTVVVTHGNLLALLLKHLDPRVGFADWQRLTNPDVFQVTFGEAAPTIVHIWHRC